MKKEIIWRASYDDIKLGMDRTLSLVRQDAPVRPNESGSAAAAAVPPVRIEFPDI
jgi:hypothetical protein